jgi:hypothetical protein
MDGKREREREIRDLMDDETDARLVGRLGGWERGVCGGG